jgi:hypothetical protein
MARPMNKTMLSIIIATQAMKELALAEISLDGPTDWYDRTEKYYTAIDRAKMEEAGLHRNTLDFRRTIDFPVSAEIRNTPFEALGKFDFDSYVEPRRTG